MFPVKMPDKYQEINLALDTDKMKTGLQGSIIIGVGITE